MRIFKFRGQGLEYVQWLYGGIAHDREAIINEDYLAIPVDRNTVGQFTGFMDIDGNEIYEDDFIQNTEHPEIIGIVEWSGDGFVVTYVNDETDDSLVWALDNAPFKIIGNIHDNPELVKKV